MIGIYGSKNPDALTGAASVVPLPTKGSAAP